MYCTLAKRLFIGLAIGFFIVSAIFTVGCTARKIKVVYEKDDNSGYSEVGHKHKKGGPPPHAPAHGYRAKHQYRYYPSCSVYYDYGRKIYFYVKGDHWEVGASLPSHLRITAPRERLEVGSAVYGMGCPLDFFPWKITSITFGFNYYDAMILKKV